MVGYLNKNFNIPLKFSITKILILFFRRFFECIKENFSTHL